MPREQSGTTISNLVILIVFPTISKLNYLFSPEYTAKSPLTATSLQQTTLCTMTATCLSLSRWSMCSLHSGHGPRLSTNSKSYYSTPLPPLMATSLQQPLSSFSGSLSLPPRARKDRDGDPGKEVVSQEPV